MRSKKHTQNCPSKKRFCLVNSSLDNCVDAADVNSVEMGLQTPTAISAQVTSFTKLKHNDMGEWVSQIDKK